MRRSSEIPPACATSGCTTRLSQPAGLPLKANPANEVSGKYTVKLLITAGEPSPVTTKSTSHWLPVIGREVAPMPAPMPLVGGEGDGDAVARADGLDDVLGQLQQARAEPLAA